MPDFWKQDFKKRIIVTLQLLLVFFILVGATTPPASETENPDLQSSPEYAPGKVIVKLKGGGLAAAQSQVAALDAIQQIQARHRIASARPVFVGPFSEPELATEVGLERIFLLDLPEGQEVQSAIAELTSDPSVEYAEPDYILTIATDTDDVYFYQQWALHNTGQYIYGSLPGSGLLDADIDIPEAWAITKGKAEIIIAVVDTGADLTHPDLASKLVPGYNIIEGNINTQDDNGHGTHVAGIAAAATNNTNGVAGVCWECKIMPVKAMKADGSGTLENVAQGVRYAADHGAHVINLSVTTDSNVDTLLSAVRYAYLKNIPTVAAMGNAGNNKALYPAAYPETIAVGATNKYDLRPSYSSFGNHIDLAAPGSDIYSTYWVSPNQHTYAYSSGTSMATPHVAGVIGLMRSITTRLTVEETRKILRDSADDLGTLGWDIYYGAGRLNAYTTLQTTKKVISSLRLAGPKYVPPETESAYSVTVSLSTAQTPITYTWTATGQDPVTSTITRLSNQVKFTWAEAGTKTVRVTASNGLTSRTVSTTVYVGWPIYMPSIRK